MSALRWLSALLLALAIMAGAALWLQRQSAAQLHGEIALLRDENRELATLRAENSRLVAAQPTAAQLASMRADHAAVAQLRGEIEKLKEQTDEKERAINEVTNASSPTAPAQASATALPIDVDANGGLLLDGVPFDVSLLKQRLAGLQKGDRFELQMQMPKMGSGPLLDDVKQRIDGIEKAAQEIARERGLKMALHLHTPPE